ncbi:MAG: hypothetical protein R3B09_31225 [Nannocystaceae bacterium]
MNPSLLAVTAPRLVDLLAFLGMGIVWVIIGALVAAIAFILRARRRDPEAWGRTPGL